MNDTIQIASVSGSVVASILFGFIVVFFAFAATRILKGRDAAGTMPYLALPRAVRYGLGVLVLAAGLAGIWHWLWSGFYTIRLHSTTITLEYLAPKRSRIVTDSSVTRFRWDHGPKSTRVLVVETRPGKDYRSMQTGLDAKSASQLLEMLRARVVAGALQDARR